MIAGAEVKIGGKALDRALADRLVEIRIEDNLMLPDAALIRLDDPSLESVDSSPLEIGAEVEISLAGIDARSLTPVFTGQVAAVEPEFGTSGAVLAARCYDHSYRLNLTKRSQTFQNMTAGDIARKVARTAAIQTGTIENGGGPYDFVQQNNETDWEFLWRIAGRIDFEVLVLDKKLHFRKAGGAQAAPKRLRWGDELLTFRPRVTAVHQADEVVVRAWDPKAKAAIEERTKSAPLDSKIGIERSSVVGAIGNGNVTVADRPSLSRGEAKELAASVMSYLANAYVEAEGSAKGDPDLRAGTKIEIDGVGKRFGGTYTASSTTHVFRGERGYRTDFTVSGRTPRSLVDLMTPAAPRRWGNSVVVGEVTQNDDPDKLGRVRVKYPALGDDTEGWWARIASPSAGKDRGLLMMPVVGEEVVIAFEHDDVRKPYVIGSLWNAQDAPGNLVQKDGSFELRSDKRITMTAKENIAVTSKKDLLVETDGQITEKAKGDLAVEGGKTVTVKAGTSLTIEAASDITIKVGSSKISMSSAGVVQISGSQIMLG